VALSSAVLLSAEGQLPLLSSRLPHHPLSYMSLALCAKSEVGDGDTVVARVEGTPQYLCVRRAPGGARGVELPPGYTFRFVHAPRPQTARHVLVVGPSGVGKSTAVNEMLSEYPGRRLVISADGEADAALSNVDDRFTADGELSTLPIEKFKSEEGTVFVFDDVEGLDGSTAKALQAFQRGVYTRGRKFNVSSITTAHVPAQGSATRTGLTEMTHVLFFPHHITRNTRYMLEKHCSLPRQFPEMARSFGDVVFVAVNDVPQVVVGRNRAEILDSALLEAAARTHPF